MGGFITVALYVAVAWVGFASGHTGLAWAGVALGVVSFWIWGVAHNFAVSESEQRIRQLQENLMIYEGLTRGEAIDRTAKIPLRANPQAIPNWLCVVHLALTVVGVVLVIVAFIAQ